MGGKKRLTNDEAIYVLKNTAWLGWDEQKEKIEEAVQMAVEALKAQLTEKDTTSDCISKQGAIDICNIVIDLWQGQLGEGALVAIKNAINNLPSVQPDIIACADCKYWICHDRRCAYWNHGVKPLEWCCHVERRTDGHD